MTTAKTPTTTPEIHTMSPHLTDLFTTFCRMHTQDLRNAIERQTQELEELERYQAAAHAPTHLPAPLPAPALFVCVVDEDRPFPDEQRLHPKSQLNVMRGHGKRQRRWRGGVVGGEVEYLYKTGQNLGPMIKLGVGTPDGRRQRWLTVSELIRCAELFRANGNRS